MYYCLCRLQRMYKKKNHKEISPNKTGGGLPMESQPLSGASTCSYMEPFTGCRWIFAPLWDFHGLPGHSSNGSQSHCQPCVKDICSLLHSTETSCKNWWSAPFFFFHKKFLFSQMLSFKKMALYQFFRGKKKKKKEISVECLISSHHSFITLRQPHLKALPLIHL